MEHRTADASRDARVTYHLVPEPVWVEQRGEKEYIPDAFEADGFIHCTNGLDPLRDVANMFYKGDERSYVVLALDAEKIRSEVRYDDPEQIYPHIYGPLNTDAVIGVFDAARGDDGTFEGFSRR
ncbi:MAG TPA: DUF952 domain-containing protein [Thermomicrobiales bacterium]|nr:DUF952 domain-containing protein [Thermomicrobiales bacterium]